MSSEACLCTDLTFIEPDPAFTETVDGLSLTVAEAETLRRAASSLIASGASVAVDPLQLYVLAWAFHRYAQHHTKEQEELREYQEIQRQMSLMSASREPVPVIHLKIFCDGECVLETLAVDEPKDFISIGVYGDASAYKAYRIDGVRRGYLKTEDGTFDYIVTLFVSEAKEPAVCTRVLKRS